MLEDNNLKQQLIVWKEEAEGPIIQGPPAVVRAQSKEIEGTRIANQSIKINNRTLNYSQITGAEQSFLMQGSRSMAQSILDLAASPGRYVQRKIRPGAVNTSVFSLIILCLGAGTLSIPYVFYSNGVILGGLLLIIGALMSLYTGWIITKCCDRLKASRYEEIALKTYGRKASYITSFCMLACQLGFAITYIVLFKELLPYTLEKLTGQSFGGGVFWSAVFSYMLIFPVSLPRTLSALRFTSFFSFIISLYIIAAIVYICIGDRNITPDLGNSLHDSFSNFDISISSVFNSLPLVIFSFMYQSNIPMIYQELENRDPKKMWKVILIGTFGATCAYFLAGVFGYTTFAHYENVSELMDKQNILKCYPQNILIDISLFGILTVIVFATPLILLPCKDSIEELLLPRGGRLSNKQNILTTLLLVTICFILSLAIPNIGDAMTILGATTNSGIGFLLPIIFYLKLERKAPRWALHKVLAYCVFTLISISSFISMGTFILKKI